MTTNKHNETENVFSIDDGDSQQLSLIMKSFARIRENENFFVKADFKKKMKFDVSITITTLTIFLLKKKSII